MKKAFLAVVVLLVLAAVVLGVKALAPHSQPPTRNPISDSHGSRPATPLFDKTTHSTTDPTSIWVVVNKQHPLQPVNYAPSDLVPVGNNQYMRAEAAQALATMLAAAKTAGYTVTPQSGYRSYQTQVAVYNSEVQAYGQAIADSESARPGYSEHQSGLAIDLGSNGCNITDCFGTTPGGEWVATNAYKFGFILRYPADLETVTGYRAEAWHFRYVGIPLATEMHQEGTRTLEQFFSVVGGSTYKS